MTTLARRLTFLILMFCLPLAYAADSEVEKTFAEHVAGLERVEGFLETYADRGL